MRNTTNPQAPPKLADLLLYLTLPAKAYNCIRGDLTEEFHRIILPVLGARKASRWYWHQVIRSIGPTIRGEIACYRMSPARRAKMTETLLQDMKYGFRMLVKHPSFTVVAVLALALGIGANTAIFSVVNTVLLRPLPYKEANRLVWVSGSNLGGGIKDESASGPDYLDWSTKNTSFESMTGFFRWLPTMTNQGEPERINGASVTIRFFEVLRTSAGLGRLFLPEDNQQGKDQIVILSRGFWERRFGGDPNVIGKTLTLNGNPYTVIGVLPADFLYPQNFTADMISPVTDAALAARSRRGDFLNIIGRLKPGVTIERAHSEMNSIAEALEKQYPNTNTGWRINMVDLHERAVGSIRLPLLVLVGAVGFLLLIACANVSNLLLVRATVRQKEIAIRTALGAGRLRLVRQLLTESVLLALAGGLLGLGLAYFGVRGLVAISPADIPRLNDTGIDQIVLGFTLLVSLITGVGFGLIPALQSSNPNLNETLKDGGRGSSQGARTNRVRSGLTVAEVSLALVLLIGAGLMIKSFVQLQKVNPGFNSDHILTLSLALPRAKYPDSNQAADFYARVIERVRALPGVQTTDVTSDIPIASGGNYYSFVVDGRPPLDPSVNQDAENVIVGPDYFKTMGIRLLKGREFDTRDGANSTPVAIISDGAMSKYWTNEDPIGQKVNFGGPRSFEIIGVVSSVKMESLDTPAYPAIYGVYTQSPQRSMFIAMHVSGDPLNLVSPIRGIVTSLDKDLPVNNVRTMEKILATSIAQQRLYMLLFGIFASVALALAGVGIYGVMGYSVRQRTHEIGVRMALGASVGDVLKLVVGQGMTLAGIGVGIGLVAALGLTRLMTNLLFGISPFDPQTFVVISLLITAVSFAACYIPARRATRVDPMKALRYE